jgi:hopanoid biosynthesis associated RND transporter like protein HpnN
LQRFVDSASDCIESRELPLGPNIATFFGSRQERDSQELYLTFDHGRIYVLIAQAKDPNHQAAAIVQLRKWIARTLSEVPGVSVEITGEPVLTYDEMVQARHDTELAALIALALTASIFIASCRGVLKPLMATFCLLIGICYTLGFAALTVGRLNILSITLVPILIGLAIDYGVHLIFRYEEEVRQGHSRQLAIAKALGFTGIGVVTNALTIAGAFYIILLTNFKGMREMGLIAGSGVIVCLLPMLTLLPLLLVGGKPDLRDQLAIGSNHKSRDPLMISLQSSIHHPLAAQSTNTRWARFEQVYLKRPWLVLLGGAIFTMFTIVGSFKVQFDYNLLHLQSRDLPAVRLQHQLTLAGSQSLLSCAVIADSLPQAWEWERRINQLPSVARVISLVKYLTEDQERKLTLIREIKQELGAIPLPELDARPVNLPNLSQTLFSLSGYLSQAINTLHAQETNQSLEELLRSLRNSVNRLRRLTASELPATAERLTTFQQGLFGSLHETISIVEQQDDRQRLQPDDVPAFLRRFFISPSGKFLLQVYPKADVWERHPQEEFIRELRTVDPLVTGSPVQFYEHTFRMKQSVQQAALYAAAIVALLVFLHFHRISSVLLALLPVAAGFCWMLGLMGWLGIPFNPVNIVSLILVIGIGVTNGVHILNRFAEEPQAAILSKSTGKAVLVSALNTMAGFGSLLVAQHQGIASLGVVMAIGTATCVVASLALLPAVLTLLSRIGWSPIDPPKKSA